VDFETGLNHSIQ